MRYLLVDGNSIGFSAFNSSKLRSGSIETQAVFGFLRTLRRLLVSNPGYSAIVAWDGRSWRKAECSEYKLNRTENPKIKKMKDSYVKQRPYIANSLMFLGVKQVSADNMEADDLIAKFAASIAAGGKDNRCKIISRDKDLLQLVRRRVAWHDPIANKTCFIGEFSEITGYATPQAYLQGKALTGDPSDNLSGVGGIGDVGARQMLEQYGSVPAFVQLYKDGKVEKCKSAWAKFAENTNGGIDIFKRNYRLMQLLDMSKVPAIINPTYLSYDMDKDAFENLCGQLAFLSILKDFDNFIKPFEGLK